MTYFITVFNRQKALIDESGPFETIPKSIAYVREKAYFTPPDIPRSNAYAAIDVNGLAHILLTPAITGVTRFRRDIQAIWIRRSDQHIANILSQMKDHEKQ